MNKNLTGIMIFIFYSTISIAQGAEQHAKIDTTNLKFSRLAAKIIGDEKNNFQKAVVLLNWVNNNLNWLATDNKK